ncbi:MAG: DUF3857 domain-containing protein, partial [Prevotellaceae bacterium]|nr:DUF3857 domain-containing protein [Prevotellaceae bacterium]
MNKTIFVVLLLLVVPSALPATELLPNLKFGKPTMEELSMKSYLPDTSATAVVLCHLTEVSYDWGVNDFVVIYSHKMRLKILKPEGTDYANINIPYYYKETNPSREKITLVDVSAYNLEEGKIVRTKMKNSQANEERIDETYMQLKFAVPQAKAGTVIEYQYKCRSDFFGTLDVWKAQRDIPTLYTEYNAVIPEYFKFNIDKRGWERLEPTSEQIDMTIFSHGSTLDCRAEHLNFKGHRLPAVKSDAHVWCADDYCTQVKLELYGVNIPGRIYRSFSRKWEDVDRLLMKDTDFGTRMRMSNPLKNEVAALQLQQFSNPVDKIAAIYCLLKSKVKWDDHLMDAK